MKKMTNAQRIAAISKKHGKELHTVAGKYGWQNFGRSVEEGAIAEAYFDMYVSPFTNADGEIEWKTRRTPLFSKDQTITLEEAEKRRKAKKAKKSAGKKAEKSAKKDAPKKAKKAEKPAAEETPKKDAPKKAKPAPNAKSAKKREADHVKEAKPATVYRTAEFTVLGVGTVKGYAVNIGDMTTGVYKDGNVWKATMNGLPVALEARTRVALVDMMSVAL